MPQVKFSGLVTDMKGKAGGSVFSSNKQGAYMRNNKWGGGRKSNRWDRSKAKLAQLSNAWQQLSAEQQQAWNNAAADFPFTNKFKEEYIGSGYQVFMSLNGTLLGNNLPLLTVPGAKRPFPEDLNVSFSQSLPPWVTTGTGATFPRIGAGTNGCYGQIQTCPICYICSQGICVPSYPTNTVEWDACQRKYDGFFRQFEPVECTSDEDCVDQGLSGASADVACQNGECVYVGDGFQNWGSFGYVLNVTDEIFNEGEWEQGNNDNQQQINTSFRFTLGADSLNQLATTQNELVLLSNYHDDGRGLAIRIRPQDKDIDRLIVSFGMNCANTNSDRITFVWYIDVNRTEFQSNCVLQLQLDFDDVMKTGIALNRSGFITPQFGWYDGRFTPASGSVFPLTGDNNDIPADWNTSAQSFGFVYGSGLYGTMNDVVYSDLRLYNTKYTDFLEPLVGYLNGFESILILANGDAKPKCNYLPCNPDLVGICKPEETCTCKHSVCGTWGQRETWHSNKAPGGNTNIALWPSVPVFNFDDPGDPQSGASFAEFWMKLDGGLYGYTGATYVPNVVMSIDAPNESGFAISIAVTNPVGFNQNSRWKPEVYAVTIDATTSGTYNLWEYIKDTIKNAPPGTSFEIGHSVVDTNSGAQRKARPRFKAGAEVSSSVN